MLNVFLPTHVDLFTDKFSPNLASLGKPDEGQLTTTGITISSMGKKHTGFTNGTPVQLKNVLFPHARLDQNPVRLGGQIKKPFTPFY